MITSYLSHCDNLYSIGTVHTISPSYVCALVTFSMNCFSYYWMDLRSSYMQNSIQLSLLLDTFLPTQDFPFLQVYTGPLA